MRDGVDISRIAAALIDAFGIRSGPWNCRLTADEVVGDVFDMLMALGDFEEFKSMMLAHRAGRKRGLTGVGSVGSCSPLGSGEHYGARPGQVAPTTGAALPPIAATSEGARRHEGKV